MSVCGNSLVITTLDRIEQHEFLRHAAWDFVIIDECLSVQNESALRCKAAWRQVEMSVCGVMMLSATFFRSKFSSLFYMIRMLRSPLPRTMEFLPALLHEHVVCEIPQSERSWSLELIPVALTAQGFSEYRSEIARWERTRLNTGEANALVLCQALKAQVRTHYERSGLMAAAFKAESASLQRLGYRPVLFANTDAEARVLLQNIPDAREWTLKGPQPGEGPIVANREKHGQGLNMQNDADAIVCRPTRADYLEQMKGRVDRPGQCTKHLVLRVIMAQHTIEEAEAANIQLAGQFFRSYIAPLARRYLEVTTEAALAIGSEGTGDKAAKRSAANPQKNTVLHKWKRLAGLQSDGKGSTVWMAGATETADDAYEELSEEEQASVATAAAAQIGLQADDNAAGTKSSSGTCMASKRPCGDKSHASSARDGNNGGPRSASSSLQKRAEVRARYVGSAEYERASPAVRLWLHPPKVPRYQGPKQEPFNDLTPPLVLTRETLTAGCAHIAANDPRMGEVIARVGVEALCDSIGGSGSELDQEQPKQATNEQFFDQLLRSITFSQISVAAGTAILKRLAYQVLMANSKLAEADQLPEETTKMLKERGVDQGRADFTPYMISILTDGQLGSGAAGAGFSGAKVSYIRDLTTKFMEGKVSVEEARSLSDRNLAAYVMGLKGIGDWCAGVVMCHFFRRADIMLYGDLTVRNRINDMYEIGAVEQSETKLLGAADFPDTPANRRLIDACSERMGWSPYRSLIVYLAYHLQEADLVLI